MTIYKKDDEFFDDLQRLNALLLDHFQIREVDARSEHTDEFGIAIAPREVYFKQEHGGSFTASYKFSREALEVILSALFQHGGLRPLGEAARKAKLDALRAAVNKIP